MVVLHHSVLGGDRGALHEGEQVPLHALPRNVGAGRFPAARDLVDLVQKHDAVLLDVGERLRTQVLLVDKASRLIVGEHPHRFADLHPAKFSPVAAQILKHAWICCVSSSIPGGANISMCACGADTSISTSLSSSSPSRSLLRNFCRVADSSSPTVPAGSSTPFAAKAPGRRAEGSRTSSTRSSAESSALRRTFFVAASRVSLIEISTRSRTIVSTSRPT